MKVLEEIRQKVMAIFEQERLKASGWIEWIHEGTKNAETIAEKDMNREFAKLSASAHCAKCMNLGGCWFLSSRMPLQPLHKNCHCKVKYIEQPIPNTTAFAVCLIEKITGWAFINPAKKRFFESNGYDIMDSNYMQAEYEQQAVKKYSRGDYKLGGVDEFGQRITIFIELKGRIDSELLRFETGWMVYPYGKIQLTTPATNLSSK